MMTECHADKEELAKVTEDRQKLIVKLKQNVEESLEYVQQNDHLQRTLSTMQELNNLLVVKS